MNQFGQEQLFSFYCRTCKLAVGTKWEKSTTIYYAILYLILSTIKIDLYKLYI
jgi:hypothetical protein